MSCGLTAILYFYLKQRLSVIETRLNTLTDLAQTLASELYQKEKQQLSQSNISDSESESESDSETDNESDTEVSEDCEVVPNIEPFKEVKLETKQIPLNEMVIELEVDPIIVLKKEEFHEVKDVKLIEVSDDESSVKQVTVDNDYGHLSLKELKQKVNDLGGPALKTKQALINFLKKKVSE
jgi:hypothetical protein